jgi:hypothetical protein
MPRLLLGQIGGRTSESALPGSAWERGMKTFRVAAERFRLNSSTYEPVILAVCGLIRWRIGGIVFHIYKLQTGL